ncbi:hypothetical protein LCGC14_1441350 [marine sediment metagenome]|uniref:Uncharacterized protein n=1 Tax=marine sediment metagenome TaxID=412755 RepID=A0A0F9K6V3_9ZZZZ
MKIDAIKAVAFDLRLEMARLEGGILRSDWPHVEEVLSDIEMATAALRALVENR